MRHDEETPHVLRLLLAGLLSTAGLTAATTLARAAGEQVTAYLTTTDDSGGRHVVRGLQAQASFTFQAGSGGSGENITVDENTRTRPSPAAARPSPAPRPG